MVLSSRYLSLLVEFPTNFLDAKEMAVSKPWSYQELREDVENDWLPSERTVNPNINKIMDEAGEHYRRALSEERGLGWESGVIHSDGRVENFPQKQDYEDALGQVRDALGESSDRIDALSEGEPLDLTVDDRQYFVRETAQQEQAPSHRHHL